MQLHAQRYSKVPWQRVQYNRVSWVVRLILRCCTFAGMFSLLEAVAFDTGYSGSNGLEPQSWVNGNGTSYIYFGSGEFDGQGSGHDFSGTLYMPPSGSINSCDGGRSHTYCDYRQQ